MKIADLHEDIGYAAKTGGYHPELNKKILVNFNEDIKGRHGDIPKYKRANVSLIFGAIFPSFEVFSESEYSRLENLYGGWPDITIPVISDIREILEQVSIYLALCKRYKDLFILKSSWDFEKFNENRIGILMSLEGCDALNKPEDLEILYLLGIRSIALTWNYNNRFASSCISNKDYGLTEMGEELVKKANELGIIIDLSHASKNTLLEVAKVSKLPIILSHSNYNAIFNHKRNADDEMIETIKKKKGVIGFTFIRSTIGKKPSLESLARHIIAVRDKYGSDILAIGTDLFGIEKTPIGLEDISKITNLISYLKKQGFNDEEIEKICWKNIMRVIEEHKDKWDKSLS